jgi:hypothetical protein
MLRRHEDGSAVRVAYPHKISWSPVSADAVYMRLDDAAAAQVCGVEPCGVFEQRDVTIPPMDYVRTALSERGFNELPDPDLPPVREQDLVGWMIRLLLHLFVQGATIVFLHFVELIYAILDDQPIRGVVVITRHV